MYNTLIAVSWFTSKASTV